MNFVRSDSVIARNSINKHSGFTRKLTELRGDMNDAAVPFLHSLRTQSFLTHLEPSYCAKT
jgi:hypothetical protein